MTIPFAVPEGWSDPEDVDTLFALGLLVGVPSLLFVLIALLVYLPGMAREAIAPAAGAWLITRPFATFLFTDSTIM